MYYLIDHNWEVVQEASNFDDLDQEPYFGKYYLIVQASSKAEALISGGTISISYGYILAKGGTYDD